MGVGVCVSLRSQDQRGDRDQGINRLYLLAVLVQRYLSVGNVLGHGILPEPIAAKCTTAHPQVYICSSDFMKFT